MFDSKDREERTSTFHVRYEIGLPPPPSTATNSNMGRFFAFLKQFTTQPHRWCYRMHIYANLFLSKHEFISVI